MTQLSTPQIQQSYHPLLWPALATLLVICWSSGFVGIRYASEEASVFLLLFWRTLLSGLILLPFSLVFGPRLKLRAVMAQMGFGVMAVFLPVADGAAGYAAGLGVVLFFLGYNPAATVLATLMMDRASPASPATDYTLQYSVNQFAAMATMSAAAALAAPLGYCGVLALATLSALAAALIALGHRTPHPTSHASTHTSWTAATDAAP